MPQLLVPNGSNVEINCTAAVDTADPPFWAIDLAAYMDCYSPISKLISYSYPTF